MTWRYSIIEADVLVALRPIPTGSFHASLSDVPYGLGSRDPTLAEIIAYLTEDASLSTGGDFMGADWHVPSVAFWRELRRVLVPGAPVLIFSGARTQDIISLGMRAAGFEIRDAIDWIQAQGMPKTVNLERVVSMALCELPGRHCYATLPKGKKALPGDHLCPTHHLAAAFEGYKTAIRPAREPIIMARVPLEGTIAENAMKYGTGGLNIDGARIDGPATAHSHWSGDDGTDGTSRPGFGDSAGFTRGGAKSKLGRFPKNIILSHADDCVLVGTKRVPTATAVRHNVGKSGGRYPFGAANEDMREDVTYADEDGLEAVEDWLCTPNCPVAEIDRQSGERTGGRPVPAGAPSNAMGGPVYSGGDGMGRQGFEGYEDEGGAARFYFCSKASRWEREFGCEDLPARTGAEAVHREEDSAGVHNPRAGAGRTAKEVRNFGPCIKPIEITTHLAKLELPPPSPDGAPRRLLVPYCGTASEMIGGLRAGWDEVVGIQRIDSPDEKAFVAIARARLKRWSEVPAGVDPLEQKPPKPVKEQMGLFGAPAAGPGLFEDDDDIEQEGANA